MSSLAIDDLVLVGGDGQRVFGPITTSLSAGESIAVTGPSGSGKTSLLRVLSADINATRGRVLVDGVDIMTLPPRGRRAHRLERIAFVRQEFDLLEELDSLWNVALPAVLAGGSTSNALADARAAMDAVDLDLDPTDVTRLSGGERQRVAIARALASPGSVVLADEPTAALHRSLAVGVGELLISQARLAGGILVVATHDMELADLCDKRLALDSRRATLFSA